VLDTGANIDVRDSSNFVVNDTLFVTKPAAGTGPVSVTTAGGTSAAVAIAVDDPPLVAGIFDLAIFPASAGADAGRYVVVDLNGSLQVLDATTLASVRTITRPGTSTSLMGVTFLGQTIVVQDAVRGNVTVPAGSLVVVNGSDLPDRLYYLNPAGTGTILADVPLGGLSPVDEDGVTSVVYHVVRAAEQRRSGDGDRSGNRRGDSEFPQRLCHREWTRRVGGAPGAGHAPVRRQWQPVGGA
jgi:hypothetical protein